MGLSKCKKQCLIETHSENLISQIRYHMVQSGGQEKSDCLIYFVDQDESGAARFEPVEISAKGNILNWPDGLFRLKQCFKKTELQPPALRNEQAQRKTNEKYFY